MKPIGMQWEELAIAMLDELRQDYVPGELQDLAGVKAISKLRAENARLRETLKELSEEQSPLKDVIDCIFGEGKYMYS